MASSRTRAIRIVPVLLLALSTLYCGEDCDSSDPLDIRPRLEITPDGSIGMLIGGQLQIDAETENVASPAITFSSSSPGVASVSSTGLVVALEEGSTTIEVRETTEDLVEHLVVTVVGFAGAAVVLDATLSPSFEAGDTIALNRVTHGRPADPDACTTVHLHTAFGQPGILIDGAGPFTDPNPSVCGFGRIIVLSGSPGMLRATPMNHAAH